MAVMVVFFPLRYMDLWECKIRFKCLWAYLSFNWGTLRCLLYPTSGRSTTQSNGFERGA